MKIRVVSYGTVMKIEQRVARQHVRGAGKDAVFRDKSEGWYATLAEWPAAVHFGQDEPDLRVGDRVKITVEKI